MPLRFAGTVTRRWGGAPQGPSSPAFACCGNHGRVGLAYAGSGEHQIPQQANGSDCAVYVACILPLPEPPPQQIPMLTRR